MHSVKNSIFASPQWAGALLLSLLTAAKLWFRGIGANIINQHLLTLSSPNHHLPSPRSNLAFLVMHFFVAYPSTAQRSLNSFTPGRVSGHLVHGWNFFSVSISPFFTKEHRVKHRLDLSLQVVVLWLKHKTHVFLQGCLTPSFVAWLLQERFPPGVSVTSNLSSLFFSCSSPLKLLRELPKNSWMGRRHLMEMPLLPLQTGELSHGAHSFSPSCL